VRIEDDVRIGKEAPELLSGLAPSKAEDVEKMAPHKKVRSITSCCLLYPVLRSAKKRILAINRYAIAVTAIKFFISDYQLWQT